MNICYYSWAHNTIFLLFWNHPSEAIGSIQCLLSHLHALTAIPFSRLRCIVLNTWHASLFLHLTLKYHTYIPYITTRTQLIQLQDYDALYSIYDMHLSSYISHWYTIHTYHILQHVLSWFICKTTMHCTQYMICISLLTSHIEIPYIHTIYYNTYSVDSVTRLRCIVLNIWYASLFLHLTLKYHTYIPCYNTYSVDSVTRLRCIVLNTWHASLFLHLTLKYHTYIPYITTRTQLQDYDALYSIYDMHLSSYISHWNWPEISNLTKIEHVWMNTTWMANF